MWNSILNKEGVEVVTVVTMKYGQEHNIRSTIFCYDSPRVKSAEPCVVIDGRYFRIKDGSEVIVNPVNMGFWPVSVGTVFSWHDGEKVLLSRKIKNQQAFLMPEKDFTFNPKSMVRYYVK